MRIKLTNIAIASAFSLLSVPITAIAQEENLRMFWFGFYSGNIASICFLHEDGIISSDEATPYLNQILYAAEQKSQEIKKSLLKNIKEQDKKCFSLVD